MSGKSKERRERERRRRESVKRAQAAQHRRERDRRRRRGPETVSEAAKATIDGSRTWHVVRALPRRTDEALDALRKIEVETFVPRWSEFAVRRHRRVVRSTPLLLRTIFVGVRDADHLEAARGVPWLADVVCQNERPIRIEARELQIFVDALAKGEVEAPVGISVGDSVIVLDGPFASFPGRVEAISSEGVDVAVAIFGRETPVRLGLEQIDCIA